MSSNLPKWYKSRGYVHFDKPISYVDAKRIVEDSLLVSTHSFYPLIRTVLKSDKIYRDVSGKAVKRPPKTRDISVASHVDSHIYSYYSYLLGLQYERFISDNLLADVVIAFRSLGRSNIDFADEVFEKIKSIGACFVFSADITRFFDNIDHNSLKRAWCQLLGENKLPSDHYSLYKSITRSSFVLKEDLFEVLGCSRNNPPALPERYCDPSVFRASVRASGVIKKSPIGRGIPQGTPISAMLSNIYLARFDVALRNIVASMGGSYYRYCDDILVIVPGDGSQDIGKIIVNLLRNENLDLNSSKTVEVEFRVSGDKIVASMPLQYLGFVFDGQRKLLRSSSLARFSNKMNRGVDFARKTALKSQKSKRVNQKIWRHQLYGRYSHLGSTNFVRYALRAAEKMKSPAIRRQVSPLWKRLISKIDIANNRLSSEFDDQ